MLKQPSEPAEMEFMSGHELVVSFCLGGAALALWLLVRFPTRGPRQPTSVIAAAVAVSAGLLLAGPLVTSLAEVGRFGAAVALLAVVLPFLTAAFWVSGCVLRALAGGPGLRS